MATTGKRQVLDGRPSVPAALDLPATRAAVDQIRTRLEKLDAAVNRAYTTLDASSPQKALESLQRQIAVLSKDLENLTAQVVSATEGRQPTYLAMQIGDDGEDGMVGPPGPAGPQGERGHTLLLDQDDYNEHIVMGPPGERGPAGPPGSTVVLDFSECCGDDFPVGFPPAESTGGGGGGGTVTSVDITAPAEGITATGGPVTSSGSITLELANDLFAVEDLFGTGFAVRTDTDTWELREITGAPTQITVMDGTGESSNPVISIDPSYEGQSSITTVGTISSGVWNGSPVPSSYGGTGLAGAGQAGNLLIGVDATDWGYLVPDADGWVLTIVTGVPAWAPAAVGTVTSVNLSAPAAGITVTGGPITSSGSITLALADDLAALEGLTGTGIAVRTGSSAWASRAILGTPNRISMVDGNGVAGDPQVDISTSYVGQTSITTLGTVTAGVWQGTGIAAGFGGTGYATYTDGDLLVGVTGSVLAKLPIGSTNQVLTVSGAGLPAWSGAPSSALTATHIGYGNGSNVLTGTSNFTWTNSTLTMQLGSGTGPVTMRTAAASSGANAASLTIQTGDANSGVVGAGLLTLQGGAGAGTSAAGSIAITAGNNPSSGAGGSIAITAGTSSGGTAGNVTIVAGGTTRVTVASTGAVTFQAGITATTGTFSSTLESTSLRVTGSTAPSNGIYLQAAGVVGLAANSTAAYKYGSNAFLAQDNNTRDLGETSTGNWRNMYSQNDVTVASDRRNKTEVETSALGLDFVLALRPVSYRQIVGSNHVEVLDHVHVVTPVPGRRRHYGFIAQEVQAVLAARGMDGTSFAGWCTADVNDPDAAQSLRYSQFIPPAYKAIQEIYQVLKDHNLI